jgi:hypothetical protein
MGMLGQSGRPVFKPSVYQPGRHNRRLPRGLGLLFIGILLGAGGVLFLQTNYAPPRLSAEQSEQVRSELNAATLERQRMQTQIDDLQRQLEASHTPPVAAPAEAASQSAPAAEAQPAPMAAEPAPTPASTPAPAAASAPAAPAPAAVQTTQAAQAPIASPAPSAVEAPAAPAPEEPKPAARRPVHHDYEEPHSQLRMTIIPITAPTPPLPSGQ